MKSGRRTLIVVAAAACLAALVWMFRGGTVDEGLVGGANVIGGVAGAVALIVALVAFWPGKGTAAVALPEKQLRDAEAYLSAETLRHWRQLAKDRRITTPSPATVRWSWAGADVAVPPVQLGAADLLTEGVVTRLRQDLYESMPVPGPRIVLLGGPGAGKTTAMMLLLIDVLGNRPVGSEEPVPVWLTLGSWDPETSLLDWAATVLTRDYPGLAATAFGGPGVVAALIRVGRVALFLDGLDEMPDTVRGRALAAIDRDSIGMRVVLTSRSEEFREASELHRLWDAAVVDVLPVRIEHACEFLLDQQTGRRREAWAKVADHLLAHRDGVAAQAFDSPLTLSLARDTYTHTVAEPTELIDAEAHPTPEALRRHLLTRLMALAYPDPVEHAHALKWLTWIAERLEGQRDLSWWIIPIWLAGSQRRLHVQVGLVISALSAVTTALGIGLLAQLNSVNPFSASIETVVISLISVTVASLIGFVGGYVNTWDSAGPSTFTLRWIEPSQRTSVIRLSMILGVPFGVLLGSVTNSFVGVLAFLLTAGAVLFAELLTVWITPLSTAEAISPLWSYRSTRQRVVLTASISGLAGGLLFTFLVQFLIEDLGRWRALVALLVASVIVGLFMTDGRPRDLTVMEFFRAVRGDRVRFMTLLETALERQVLRQAGAIYQFRHAELQDLLTDIDLDAGIKPGAR
ncbi:hypothetical protein [Paractinoplanes toevensis]|uniref:hypothetical protein n=1 Tax=Paractinoplanes toevensis TaxID=571911 RepID=UPI001BB395EA|nr:hypothetical protein [Actinoplanes toevensis]